MYTSPFLDIDKLWKTSWAQKVSGATEKWTQGQEKKTRPIARDKYILLLVKWK